MSWMTPASMRGGAQAPRSGRCHTDSRHPRTTAILQVLHHLSAEQQVITFSHDTRVLTAGACTTMAPNATSGALTHGSPNSDCNLSCPCSLIHRP